MTEPKTKTKTKTKRKRKPAKPAKRKPTKRKKKAPANPSNKRDAKRSKIDRHTSEIAIPPAVAAVIEANPPPAPLPEPPAELTRKITSLSRDGLSPDQIHQWAQDLPDELSDGEIIAGIQAAERDIAATGNISEGVEIGRSIARLNDLYARMHQMGDLRGCLQVQQQMTTLALKAIDRPEPITSAIPPEDVQRKVNELARNGVSDEDIRKWARGAGVQKIEDRILMAEQAITRSAKVNLDLEAGKAMSRLDDLYAKLYAAGDFKGALAVQKQHTSILGLDRADKNVAMRRVAMSIIDIADQFIEHDRRRAFVEEVTAWFRDAKRATR